VGFILFIAILKKLHKKICEFNDNKSPKDGRITNSNVLRTMDNMIFVWGIRRQARCGYEVPRM